MKYYFHCKLFDGKTNHFFRKNHHIIQMISIGIVCEDGRSYYALSRGFNASEAPKDIFEQIIVPICNEFITRSQGKAKERLTAIAHKQSIYVGVAATQIYCGRDVSEIAKEIESFITYRHITIHDPERGPRTIDGDGKPLELWGYDCEFDWVAICGLFGGIRKIPEQFPGCPLNLVQMIAMCNMGPGWETTTDPERKKTPISALACAESHMKLYNSLMVAIEKEPVGHHHG